jgi:protein TonB
MVSLAAHGAVLVVGLTVLRPGDSDAPPAIEFTRGDGGSGGGFFVAGAPTLSPDSSPVPPQVSEPVAPVAPPVTAEETAAAEWTARDPAPIELADGTESAEVGPIGLPVTGPPAAPRVRTAGPPGFGGDDGAPGTAGIPGGLDDPRLPAPVYPRESRRRGEQGTVVIEVDVASDGSVAAVRVVDDAGFPRLAEAAVDAARKARLRPDSRVRIPFRFRLR